MVLTQLFNGFVRTKRVMHVKWCRYEVSQEAHDGHAAIATAGPAAFASQTRNNGGFAPVRQADNSMCSRTAYHIPATAFL